MQPLTYIPVFKLDRTSTPVSSIHSIPPKHLPVLFHLRFLGQNLLINSPSSPRGSRNRIGSLGPSRPVLCSSPLHRARKAGKGTPTTPQFRGVFSDDAWCPRAGLSVHYEELSAFPHLDAVTIATVSRHDDTIITDRAPALDFSSSCRVPNLAPSTHTTPCLFWRCPAPYPSSTSCHRSCACK